MRCAVERKKKVCTQEMEVQTEEFYPFDEILRSRKFVPKRLQDACVSRVYISIPGFCRSVECLAYSETEVSKPEVISNGKGKGKSMYRGCVRVPRFVVYARDIGKKIASVNPKYAATDCDVRYVSLSGVPNESGFTACAIDDVDGIFVHWYQRVCEWYGIRNRKNRKIRVRTRQVRDVLHQQHHEYCSERQSTKGWWCISRTHNWQTAIKDQVRTSALCDTEEQGAKGKGTGKGTRWEYAASIVNYLEECYSISCNPRACEDLCASICVRRYRRCLSRVL